MKLYTISSKYINNIRTFDERVSLSTDEKARRPFVGVVLKVSEKNYFAPLGSPKPKHITMKNQKDFLKINDGKWGVINFNNMLPVPLSEVNEVNLNGDVVKSKNELLYKQLLRNQTDWCKINATAIKLKAILLYDLICGKNAPSHIKERCCDFKKLEQACEKYEQSQKPSNSFSIAEAVKGKIKSKEDEQER